MTKLVDMISIKRTVFIILVLVAFFFPISNALADMMFRKGLYFIPTDISGDIVSSLDFFVDKCTFEDNLVIFHGLNMGYGEWVKLGVNCFPQSTQITLEQISTNKIEYTIYAPSGEGLTQIYIGSKGYPSKIRGANRVELDEETKILTVYTLHTIIKNISVELTFASTTMVDTVADLMANNDYLGAAFLGFTISMGQYVFYGLVFMTLTGAFVIRYQSFIPVLVFGLIGFAIFQTIIPAPVMGIVVGLMVLVGGTVIFRLFVRDRSY